MRLAGAFGLVFVLVMFLAGPAISQANSGFAPIEIRLVAQEAGNGPTSQRGSQGRRQAGTGGRGGSQVGLDRYEHTDKT